MTTPGEWLSLAMHHRGLNELQASIALGVSVDTIRNWITGRVPVEPTAERRLEKEYRQVRRAYFNMWRRCTVPEEPSYQHYGGRGIKVSAVWDTPEAFFKDMGMRPSPKHSIDRIDNDGDYEPGNCRWATANEQAVNKRPRKRRASVQAQNREAKS